MAGKVLQTIQENGYIVSAASLLCLSKKDASEFFEIYKGVVYEYPEMVNQLISGPCMALEIGMINFDLEVQSEFRKFVGPADPVGFIIIIKTKLCYCIILYF